MLAHDYSFFGIVGLLAIGGPFLIHAFRLYSEAICTVREEYPDSYAALGSPSGIFPPCTTGSMLASQGLLLALLFHMPKAVPEDPDVRRKLKRVQLIARLWNVLCLPVITLFLIERASGAEPEMDPYQFAIRGALMGCAVISIGIAFSTFKSARFGFGLLIAGAGAALVCLPAFIAFDYYAKLEETRQLVGSTADIEQIAGPLTKEGFVKIVQSLEPYSPRANAGTTLRWHKVYLRTGDESVLSMEYARLGEDILVQLPRKGYAIYRGK